MHATSSTTEAREHSAPGAAVFRDSAWVLLGVLIGAVVGTAVLPDAVPTTLTLDPVSAASITTFTMLLSTLRDH